MFVNIGRVSGVVKVLIRKHDFPYPDISAAAIARRRDANPRNDADLFATTLSPNGPHR